MSSSGSSFIIDHANTTKRHYILLKVTANPTTFYYSFHLHNKTWYCRGKKFLYCRSNSLRLSALHKWEGVRRCFFLFYPSSLMETIKAVFHSSFSCCSHPSYLSSLNPSFPLDLLKARQRLKK